MRTAKRTGRVIGVLWLIQMVISSSVNFALLDPVFTEPGFLVNAAHHPTRMALAAVLGITGGMLTIAVSVIAFGVLRRLSPALALWLVALSAVGLAVNVGESISVMSLLSLSQAYAQASGAARDLYPSLRIVVAAARNWAHYTGLIIGGSNLMVSYLALLRFALIPRVVAGLGVAAVLVQLVAVTMPLFGHEIIFALLGPVGLVQLTATVWMIAKGWPDGDPGAGLA